MKIALIKSFNEFIIHKMQYNITIVIWLSEYTTVVAMTTLNIGLILKK